MVIKMPAAEKNAAATFRLVLTLLIFFAASSGVSYLADSFTWIPSSTMMATWMSPIRTLSYALIVDDKSYM